MPIFQTLKRALDAVVGSVYGVIDKHPIVLAIAWAGMCLLAVIFD